MSPPDDLPDAPWSSQESLPDAPWAAPPEPPKIPEPFLFRLAGGAALQRAMSAGAQGAKEGFGDEKLGLSDENVKALQDWGVFHDPSTGPMPMSEHMMRGAAVIGDVATRGINAALYGAGSTFGQVVGELGGDPNRAREEAINFGNFLMNEGAASNFSRPHADPTAPLPQQIGTLPKDGDFAAGAKVLGGPPAVAESNLKTLWEDNGVHPAEAVHDAQSDAFLKQQLVTPERDPATKLPPEAWSPENLAGSERIAAAAIRVDGQIFTGITHADAYEAASQTLGREVEDPGTGFFVTSLGRPVGRAEALKIAEQSDQVGRPGNQYGELLTENMKTPVPDDSEAITGELHAAGADVTRDAPSLAQQPAPPASSLVTMAQGALDRLYDIGRDTQMLVAPMATGTRDSMAIAKDFANSLRRNRWEWSRIDDDVAKRFDPEQRKRMWDAADEESVMRQSGETSEHMGLATLEPEERAAVEQLQTRAQTAWLRARDLGMVEGEGLPAYTPRMVINAAVANSADKALPLNVIGRNLKVRTGQMLHRKYLTAEETEAAAKSALGEGAEIARDIRVLPLATAKLEDAIAGRGLIENIKAIGKQTGDDTVTEGGKPAGSDQKWFTLDHPAFRTWRPKFEEVDGKMQAALDANGNPIFQQTPIYVRGDFEGPLRAVLTHPSGALYGAAMSLKGKTMSMIMNSPLIHNAVEWGRALPAMPGKVASFKVYFEGNRAKNDPAVMTEAINAGLVPIGHRFFNQDISSIMEEPNLTPGRSWTSQILGFVPGLFDEGAGNAVKGAIDKAGDFWHNTMLWDRVADLQMGLYSNFKADLTARGVDNLTAARAAAHWANRYAGSLPKEAMSDGATKIANLLMFSRTFTMGNLGVMKDMVAGLPKDVLAQIERDGDLGKRAERVTDAAVKFNDKIYTGNNHLEALEKAAAEHGTDVENIHTKADDNKETQFDSWVTSSGRFIDSKEAAKVTGSMHDKLDSADPEFESQRKGETQTAVQFAKSMARRKAMSVVLMDMGLFYVGNSLLQNGLNVMLGDSTLDKEMHAYAQRLSDALTHIKEHPLSLVQPFNFFQSISATNENEPGRQDRVAVGYAKDGTAIYARNPAGKIGEEFTGYLTGPLDMMRRKLGPLARRAWQIMANDAGFGRKIYDPNADTPAKYLANLGKIALHIAGSQFPEGQIGAFSDLVKGQGDAKVNALQAFGPIAGTTFSKGAPGGPAVGEMYQARTQHDYAVDAALPSIRRQIQSGDVMGARQAMTGLGIPAGLQNFYVRTSQNPATRLSGRTLRDFYNYATPEQKQRLEADRAR